MSDLDQTNYLLQEQYKDATKLNARIALHQRFSVNPEPWWDWYWRILHLPERANILEVGTGPADLWRTQMAHIPSGWQITLSDFSPGMLAQARQNLGESTSRFAFSHFDVVDIPFADATFDGVFANFMLYHAPDLDRALTELYRVLKPGGRLYAATNGFQHMRQINDLLHQLDPNTHIYAVISSFSLENGGEALHRYFPTVNLYLYDDAFQVTDVEALMAFIFSMQRPQIISQNPEFLRRAIAQKIEEEGAFYIEKHSGVFEAIKVV